MPGLIGRKIGMTSVFSADGKNVPCTVIEAGPCVVTQVKTVDTDGYNALQLAFGEAKEKNTTKPMPISTSAAVRQTSAFLTAVVSSTRPASMSAVIWWNWKRAAIP